MTTIPATHHCGDSVAFYYFIFALAVLTTGCAVLLFAKAHVADRCDLFQPASVMTLVSAYNCFTAVNTRRTLKAQGCIS